jgi:hypothetical protein
VERTWLLDHIIILQLLIMSFHSSAAADKNRDGFVDHIIGLQGPCMLASVTKCICSERHDYVNDRSCLLVLSPQHGSVSYQSASRLSLEVARFHLVMLLSCTLRLACSLQALNGHNTAITLDTKTFTTNSIQATSNHSRHSEMSRILIFPSS